MKNEKIWTRTSGEGGGFGNSDTPGQGEGVVWKSEILADVLCRRPLRHRQKFKIITILITRLLIQGCIQDTISSRAALGLTSASREQRYLAYKLYTRYPIFVRALGLAREQRYLTYKHTRFGWWLIALHSNITCLTLTHSLDGSGEKIKTLTLYSDPNHNHNPNHNQNPNTNEKFDFLP